jgi:hypothetical protein
MKTAFLLPALIASVFVIASCKNNKESNTAENKTTLTGPEQDTGAIITQSHFVKYSVAKVDSANFSTYWKSNFDLKQEPLKYARIRVADMLLSMGIWDQNTINQVDTTNIGVVLTIGWDRIPKKRTDTVAFHVFLQPVRFNAARDSIKEFLYFNAYRQIVDKNRNPYKHTAPPHDTKINAAAELYVTDLNNPCPPLCAGQ